MEAGSVRAPPDGLALLDSPDVHVEVFYNIAGSAVRMTHVPTGLVVASEQSMRSQIEVKQELAAELERKIAEVQKLEGWHI